MKDRTATVRTKLGDLLATYAPLWLQVSYALLLLAFKPQGAWRTLPADICFAGFAFFVWGMTMHMNAGKRIAGGGRYASSKQSRKEEYSLCLLILLLSVAGTATGYRRGGIAAVAWVSFWPMMILSTWLLMPAKR